MSLLVYAVTDAPAADIRGTGLHGSRLRAVCFGELAAIVGELPAPDGPISGSEPVLWEYEHAIERLMAGRVILPARFGSILGDEQMVRAMLELRARQLSDALRRVRGAVEFGLTVAWASAAKDLEATGPQTGTEYLLGRLAHHRRALELAELFEPLAEIARATRRRLVPDPRLALTVSYLIDESRLEEFTALLSELDPHAPDLDLVCTGPWPPFSFVEGIG